jgi:cytochrome c553
MNKRINMTSVISAKQLLTLCISYILLCLLLVSSEVSSTELQPNADALTALSLVSIPRGSANASCIDCHGKTGNSNNSVNHEKQTPKLAAQDMSYLYSQLINFKQGRRFTDIKTSNLQNYTDQELQLIAHYFANQTLVIDPNADVTLDTLTHSKLEDKNWSKQGESLYLKGDFKRKITACQTCHGEYGEGRIIGLDKAPKLTGQHARYVRMTLDNYAKGRRTTDTLFDDSMQVISRKLTDIDRRNLAAYIQGLNSPN